MKSNKYPLNENGYDSDSFSNYEKKMPSFIKLTSSESSSEEKDIKLVLVIKMNILVMKIQIMIKIIKIKKIIFIEKIYQNLINIIRKI